MQHRHTTRKVRHLFLFTCSIILGLAAVGLFFAGKTVKGSSTTKFAPAIVVGAIALLFLVFASTTMVSTKNIGVVTTFNKPTGHLTNGIHLKAPWSKVTEFDGAIQIDTRAGDTATEVRLGNSSMARVDNSVRWRMRPEASDELFLNYRDFDKIRDDLVIRELNVSLNDVFADFDPINEVAAAETSTDVKPAAVKTGSAQTELAEKVAEDLRRKVGDQIEILDVGIPVVHFDQSTQDRINAYQAEVGNTRIAEQKAATAAKEAEANRALSASISNDPNVLVSKCLDIIKESGQSPLGCWGGTTTIVPQR